MVVEGNSFLDNNLLGRVGTHEGIPCDGQQVAEEVPEAPNSLWFYLLIRGDLR